MLITDPSLNCFECYKRKREEGEIPLCFSDGCPIEEEARSVQINNIVIGFTNYKRLVQVDAPSWMQIKALKDYGLWDFGYDLILELETVQREFEQRLVERKKEGSSKVGKRVFNG